MTICVERNNRMYEKDASVAIEIGDVAFLPEPGRLRLRIAEQQDSTTWSIEGVTQAIAYLQGWLATRPQHVPLSAIEEEAPDA
jgi:hypothetical protein